MSVATDLRPPGDPGPQRPPRKHHRPYFYALLAACGLTGLIALVLTLAIPSGSSNAPADAPRHNRVILGSDPHSGPTYPPGNAEITHAPGGSTDLCGDVPASPVTLAPGSQPGTNEARILSRLTEWWIRVGCYVTDHQVAERAPALTDSTSDWITYTNAWAYNVPTNKETGFTLNPYAGRPFAANGVVMRESDPGYPKADATGIHAVWINPQTGFGGDVTPVSLGQASTVRYWAAQIYRSDPRVLYVLQRREFLIDGVPTAFITRKTCPTGSIPATCLPD